MILTLLFLRISWTLLRVRPPGAQEEQKQKERYREVPARHECFSLEQWRSRETKPASRNCFVIRIIGGLPVGSKFMGNRYQICAPLAQVAQPAFAIRPRRHAHTIDPFVGDFSLSLPRRWRVASASPGPFRPHARCPGSRRNDGVAYCGRGIREVRRQDVALRKVTA